MNRPSLPSRTGWSRPASRATSGGSSSVAMPGERASILQCKPVRDLLVDYLKERQPALDYASLDSVSRSLAGLFWAPPASRPAARTRPRRPAAGQPPG